MRSFVIEHSSWLSLQSHHHGTDQPNNGSFFSSHLLNWFVCTYILHACQAMCVLMQCAAIDLCLNLHSAAPPLSSKHSRSHLGRNPLRAKSIPQRFHAAAPSMPPCSRLARASASDTWFHRRRPRSRTLARWWRRSRGGSTDETSTRSGDCRCCWKRVMCGKVSPALPGSARLGSTTQSHWSDESLSCRLSCAPPEPRSPPCGRRAQMPAKPWLSVYPFARENPSPSAVWCWIRAAARQRACQAAEWINAGRFVGLLCSSQLCCTSPLWVLYSPNDDSPRLSSSFSFFFFLLLLLFDIIIFAEMVFVPPSPSFPASSGAPEVQVPYEVWNLSCDSASKPAIWICVEIGVKLKFLSVFDRQESEEEEEPKASAPVFLA